jgi:hypothetical protein
MLGMEWLMPLLGGLGLGSVAGVLVNAWLQGRRSDKELRHAEKREAYLALLEALHQAAVDRSGAGAKAYGLAMARVHLVGSPQVVEAGERVRRARAGSDDMLTAQNALFAAMRKDLGVDPAPLARE